jgi:DNA-binding beta-propeller fold protein YncE
MSRSLAPALVALALIGSFTPGPALGQHYHLARTITLGGDGGWDYLTVDTLRHHLYIARQNRVMVVDLESGQLLAEIPGFEGAHGVTLVDRIGHGFATSGRDSALVMFDPGSYQVQRRTKVGGGADAVLYDPVSNRILTFDGTGRDATVVEPSNGTVLGSIPLGAKPEFGVFSGEGHVFVNLEDTGELAELDPAAIRLVRRWPLGGCEEPTGLAIDRARYRLFSACSNQVMAISDAEAGKVIATVPIGAGVDGAAYDSTARLAFASGGDGTITVIGEGPAGGYRVLETVPTRRGARTMTIDPATHRLLTVSAELGPAPAPTAERPRPRPAIVPGTFSVLVFER